MGKFRAPRLSPTACISSGQLYLSDARARNRMQVSKDRTSPQRPPNSTVTIGGAIDSGLVSRIGRRLSQSGSALAILDGTNTRGMIDYR